ncbi:hypothetical protein [Antrihabitans cavernicola]|uniref:hypothetical protein n=1 Tax=Antrihabitans cavernicola TaxID=2495913 RepID=UPI001F401965|nr:hypothetical protein [Spelaeibacter cavernicola]
MRFLTEIIAWVATPWALWSVSPILAVLSVIVLIGLPTVFATPQDKKQVLVPVPGVVTIAILALTLAAAAIAPWIVWNPIVAVLCVVLVIATIVFEIPRWRWLVRQ